MPARDTYHEAVKNSLVKDGWTITHDPLIVELAGDRLFIDLGAERVIAAEKGTRKIAVEIKTFGGPSKMTDMERAIGQYVLYRIFLKRTQPERECIWRCRRTYWKTCSRECRGAASWKTSREKCLALTTSARRSSNGFLRA